MVFHPKNLKSETNNSWFKPWFTILLHTQSIVCAAVDSQCLNYFVITWINLRKGGKVRYFCSIFGHGNHRGKIKLSLKSLRNFWSNELQKIDERKRAPIFHYSDILKSAARNLEKINFSKEIYKSSWYG